MTNRKSKRNKHKNKYKLIMNDLRLLQLAYNNHNDTFIDKLVLLFEKYIK